jgi:hypothetical protein
MSELGDFLERFYGPVLTFRTVRARVRHVQKSPPQGSIGRKERPIGRRRTDLPSQVEREALFQLWGSLPDCVRLEASRIRDGHTETSLEIVNREDAWKRHANGTMERGSARRSRSVDRYSLPTEYQRHFDRALIRECFAALTLESQESCEVAGRRCLKIRAIKIPGTQLWPHWFAWEAAEFELAADVERSTLLSIVGIVEGEAVETHEVLEVSYDEDLDTSLFTYQPEIGETVHAAIPVSEHLSWKAAAQRAPFRLLKPAFIPEGQRDLDEVIYHPARPGSLEEHVTIFYRSDRSSSSLWISQRAERDMRSHEKLAWDDLSRNDRTFELSDPGTEDGLRLLAFEQDGTDVLITSDLPVDDLVEIACSMIPA